jgi:hypothetical protein
MDERKPSFFMLVPGPWREPPQVTRALAGQDSLLDRITLDVIRDSELASGFAWGRQGPLAKELVARVGACSHAALIEFHGRLDEHASQVAALGRALREAGGVAVRMEASGAASSWEPWLERLESGDSFRIYESAVLAVHGEDSILFTCGMHHFDLPDAQVALQDPREAVGWLDAFCEYQLTDEPGLASGHTFRPRADAQQRVLERWPDHRHHPSDGRCNPFGIWRLLEPGASGLRAGRTVATMIPSLVSLLTAAESSTGRSLTRREVEEIVATGPAIAMEPRDVQALERSRGYADIEPELAWEQWQIVRRGMSSLRSG